MTEREKLNDILCDALQINGCIHSCNHPPCRMVECAVDALIANGVTFSTDINDGSKYGHWIIRSTGKGRDVTNWAECSECHVCGSPQWKVCPVCETKMDLEEK